METKTIRVNISVYNRLNDKRKGGESFNKFFERTILKESKP